MHNLTKLPIFLKAFILSFLLFHAGTATAQDKTVTEIAFDHDANLETFAFGADISWLSQQESWGTYYCNRQGKKADLMDILKNDFGINALRFRVWVNPAGGWSGKKDVIALCKRAHAKGFKIMISFHYSDTWADSQNQTIPAQWTDHSAEALEKNVYDHTKDVLTGLKKEGIIPKWVSIGNETKFGMLYETGRTNSTQGVQNFVRFINAGAKAVKEIDSSIITIIHLSNGHDESTARKMFDNLEKYGANYDCLGFSCYPRWSHLDVTTDAQIKSAVNTYLTVFKNLKNRFNKPIMVMETGHYGTEPYDANRFFAEFIKTLISDKELGCFYWEPEAFDNSGYNLGAWSSVTHQGTIAMDAFKGVKHTKVSKYATATWTSMNDTIIYPSTSDLEFKLLAKTPTTVTKMQNIDLYADGTLNKTIVPEGKETNFTLQPEGLEEGAHSFHALVYDNQGHYESTDTVHLLVGDVAVFQENSEAFEGITDGELTVAKKIIRYTGEGYIPAAETRKTTLNYSIAFPEAGTYTLYIRYHSNEKRTLYVRMGDKSTSISGSTSPVGRWAYTSKNITIDAPGTYSIAINGLSKGYPDIDFIAIASPVGVAKVTAGNATGIIDMKTLHEDNGHIYDLRGISHIDSESTPRGIYIKNGKKIIKR